MNSQTDITTLVRKLLNDSLSLQELRELQQLFRAAEAQGETEQWLSALWQSVEGQRDTFIHQDEIYKRLIQKIQPSQTKYTAATKECTDDRTLRWIHSAMRYAAVFVLTMALSWYWFRSDKPVKVSATALSIPSVTSEVSVTYGSKTRILLPDSSVVFLNSGSTLSYPSVFDSERHVTLTGEGYFMVRSDSLHPFLVHASDVCIKALGTEFNVKAYPEEQNVETVLVSGSVKILKQGQSKPIVELKPGERASYTKNTPKQLAVADKPAKIEHRMKIDIIKPEESTGWVNNRLEFDAEPFEQIAVRLERWFNVEIEIKNARLSKTRLSGRYDTENIEQVMHSLQMAASFTYKIEKNRIIIK
jgi:ferric-dicitrate binding protein FerR (iron transport regulator)